MSPRPIEQAHDPDLRSSAAALARAALRAHELAARTGTPVVVTRAGVIEHMLPTVPTQTPVVQEPGAAYGPAR